MNKLESFLRSRLAAALLVFSLVAPLAQPLLADPSAAHAPAEVSSGANVRRPWFKRQLDGLLKVSGPAKDDMRRTLAAEIQKRITTQSNENRAKLNARSKANLRTIYDIVVVGAGIHSAIFNATIARNYPEARVLTIEASDTLVKVFNGCGPMFRINSPELGTATANLIASSPVQLAQLTDAKFATAEMLGQVAMFALFNSTSGFLLEARVDKIERSGDMYTVRMQDGLTVVARHVVVATGLGQPDLKTDDKATYALVKDETSKACTLGETVPDIQFFDDAVQKAKLTLDMGLSPLAAYAGKRVMVVGAGDAGNVWVEFLLGKAPAEVYAKQKTPLEAAKTIWLGQKSKTIDEFKAANKPRYHEPLKDLYADTRIEMTAAKLSTIRYAAGEDAKKGKFAVSAVNGDKTEAHFVDQIIIATGYKNLAPMLVAHCGPSPQLQPIKGPANGIGESTALALQVKTSDSVLQKVYVIGPAAAPLAADDELKATITKNHHSINVLGPRSEGLANLIIKALQGAVN
jgi:hypothetical protein